MNRIFVNGFNSNCGGGKSILSNFISILSQRNINQEFYFLVKNSVEYTDFATDMIKFIQLPLLFSKSYLLPFVNKIILPKLIDHHQCNLVFNLADVPIPTHVKQIMLFDWPYAVFPESLVWQIMDYPSLLKRKIKLYLFKKNLKYVDKIIAQSHIIKHRLEKYYDLKNIEIIPNAVSVQNINKYIQRDFGLNPGLNLLYLTYYYPHKNLEIFIPLAKEILRRGDNIHLITTISPQQHPYAKRFLDQIVAQGLQDVIINIGPVTMSDVPSLYMQTDGLLMPTLLESFSGTYVEAMFHDKPIYTSNLDFATGICSDAAYYFDPFDPQDILDKIIESQRDPVGKTYKIHAGKRVLNELLTWEQAFDAYSRVFALTMARS